MKFSLHTVPSTSLNTSFSSEISLAGRKEKSQQFEIFEIDTRRGGMPFTSQEEERIQTFEICFFTAGDGFIKIDTEIFQLKNNTVFCFIPGQVRRFLPGGREEGYCIRFSPHFLFGGSPCVRVASWLDSYGSGLPVPVIEPDSDTRTEMVQLFRAMLKEFTNYFLLRAEILAGLLNILLIHLSRRLQLVNQDFTVTKDSELVHQFKALLRKHFITKKQVADYASELCVTPNYLNKTIKKVTGFTASHHIQQQIVLEAKRQAIHSNGSMKEIAYFLGFDNLAHFSKFFKNNSGMNFTSFKKDHQTM